MKLGDVFERLKHVSLVDVLMTIGFSIVGLCGVVAWVMFMAQLWAANPLVGGFLTAFSIGFAFIIAGMILMDKRGRY